MRARVPLVVAATLLGGCLLLDPLKVSNTSAGGTSAAMSASNATASTASSTSSSEVGTATATTVGSSASASTSASSSTGTAGCVASKLVPISGSAQNPITFDSTTNSLLVGSDDGNVKSIDACKMTMPTAIGTTKPPQQVRGVARLGSFVAAGHS